MILNGLKNYFINLKHFFTPIGTLAVGMFIGLSILIPGAFAVVVALIGRLAETAGEANVDFEAVKNYIVDAVNALDWSDPIASLKIMLTREWLTGVVNGCLDIVASGLKPFEDAVTAAVNDAVFTLTALIVTFFLLCIIGLIGGYWLTRFLVRRTMAKRTFKKFMFALFVDSFVTAALIALSAWLLTVWAPSVFITSIMSFLIFGAISLVSAYCVHGRNVVGLKTVLNIVNVLKLLLVNTIIFVVSLALFILTAVLTNPIAGALIGFSFVEIAFIVMSLNAESYVLNLASKTPQTEELREAA